ncbi:MFS transporter [Chryseobacterium limigenitum]|uniref:Uncharacterized protein n=1 Tax=Chryseobacterium limigenitum TaxID=1612149 RepID=A0A1K2IX38_9FLAO|nr:MFS transporter [Chryseobacterium limigenitum]SFZ96927.1 hypothetical protein SAMN05216324_13021 [Chryseobacterium limigenitum]
METHNQKIIKPSKEKMEVIKKDLNEKISDSTEDLLRLVVFWSWWMKFLSNQSILKILHQSRALLNGKLQFLKQDFEKNVVQFKQLTQNFMRLTSVTGDDKILDIAGEKQEVQAKSDLARTYSQEVHDHIAGNIAKSKILQSDSEINFSEAESIKSQNYIQAVKKSDLEIKIYPSKPELDFAELTQLQTETVASTEIPQEQVSVEKEQVSPAVYSKPKQVIYTQVGSAPDFYTAEAQFEETLLASGENYALQYSNPTKENAESVNLSNTSKDALKQPTYNQNILSFIGLDKVIWVALVYFIAIAGEILIFSAIFSVVYNFDPVKSFVAGLCPTLLSFGIGYALYGNILHFTKNNNQIARKLFSSVFMTIAMILALTYAASMGLLYKNTLDQDELYGQMTMQKQELYEYNPEILDEDMTAEERDKTIRENGTKVDEINTKLVHLQEGPMATIGKLTIAFSSLIFLLFSGICFGIFILFLSSYKLQKAIRRIQNRLPRIEAEFHSQKNVIMELDNLSNRILHLLGQKRFVEKLLAGDETKDILYTPPAKEEPKPTFSSNGTYHHSEEINSNN